MNWFSRLSLQDHQGIQESHFYSPFSLFLSPSQLKIFGEGEREKRINTEREREKGINTERERERKRNKYRERKIKNFSRIINLITVGCLPLCLSLQEWQLIGNLHQKAVRFQWKKRRKPKRGEGKK